MSLFDILAESKIFIWHKTPRVSDFHVGPVSRSICEVNSLSVFRTLDTLVKRNRGGLECSVRWFGSVERVTSGPRYACSIWTDFLVQCVVSNCFVAPDFPL
jgi:hypothetical protein